VTKTTEEIDELLKYLDTAPEQHLANIRKNDQILKVVTNDTGFFLLTTSVCTEKSGKARKFIDINVLYCSSKSYEITTHDWTFITSRSYEHHGFWEIPKEFFPEYYL